MVRVSLVALDFVLPITNSVLKKDVVYVFDSFSGTFCGKSPAKPPGDLKDTDVLAPTSP
jgi:hypothetical protein